MAAAWRIFGAGTLTLPNGAVEHYEEDVNERYLREMNYFLDYAAGEETESLNPPATALQVLKLTLGGNNNEPSVDHHLRPCRQQRLQEQKPQNLLRPPAGVLFAQRRRAVYQKGIPNCTLTLP